jgi:hypothetical protein
MSLIKLRLDISSLSATSQKPWCECTRAFLLMARAELAQGSDKNKKTQQTPKADAGFFLCQYPHWRIMSEANNPCSASALQGF